MIARPPQRIVTLLPSATEIVCALGLIDRLVGVTHECDHPPEVQRLPRVTSSAIPQGLASGEIDRLVRDQLQGNNSLYSLDARLLERLQPDLIVTQALCNVCAVADAEVRRIARRLASSPTVINLEPMSLADVFSTIEQVGCVAGEPVAAKRLLRSLEARVQAVRESANEIPPNRRPTVALLEWIDPPFNAGHWNPELIDIAGGIDCLGNIHEASRTIAFEEIASANPDILVVALCGFDVERAREDIDILRDNMPWEELEFVRRNQVHVLDGSAYFSRSGPRLVDSLELLGTIVRTATEQCPAQGVAL